MKYDMFIRCVYTALLLATPKHVRDSQRIYRCDVGAYPNTVRHHHHDEAPFDVAVAGSARAADAITRMHASPYERNR